MVGSDAGGPRNLCYCEYKHVSVSDNVKRRKGFRTEGYVNSWIRKYDKDAEEYQDALADVATNPSPAMNRMLGRLEQAKKSRLS